MGYKRTLQTYKSHVKERKNRVENTVISSTFTSPSKVEILKSPPKPQILPECT